MLDKLKDIDFEKIKGLKNWGLTHTLSASAVASIMGISYIHNYVYTRSEGETLERRYEASTVRSDERVAKMDAKVDRKLERINDKLTEIKADIQTLMTLQRQASFKLTQEEEFASFRQ